MPVWFVLILICVEKLCWEKKTNRKRNPLWKRFKNKTLKSQTFSVCLCFVVLFLDAWKINYIIAGAYVYRDLWSNRFQIKWFYRVSAHDFGSNRTMKKPVFVISFIFGSGFFFSFSFYLHQVFNYLPEVQLLTYSILQKK